MKKTTATAPATVAPNAVSVTEAPNAAPNAVSVTEATEAAEATQSAERVAFLDKALKWSAVTDFEYKFFEAMPAQMFEGGYRKMITD